MQKKMGKLIMRWEKMISNQNPIAGFRKLIKQVKGIEKVDEWKIYIAVAFLSMVISLLFILYRSFIDDTVVSVNKNQHITLALKTVIKKPAAIMQSKSVATEKINQPVQAVEESKPSMQSGEWYYDELHKDWRYRK